MLNMELFAKVLALAGSNSDGEALAAVRKAGDMLKKANMSFTDISMLVGKKSDSDTNDMVADFIELSVRLEEAKDQIKAYKAEIKELRKKPPAGTTPSNLKRSRTDIETAIRAVFKDEPTLSDRAIARRLGLSPQTVGNWRRRLEAERVRKRANVHHGRKRAA